jgi:hypothetical protein
LDNQRQAENAAKIGKYEKEEPKKWKLGRNQSN